MLLYTHLTKQASVIFTLAEHSWIVGHFGGQVEGEKLFISYFIIFPTRNLRKPHTQEIMYI